MIDDPKTARRAAAKLTRDFPSYLINNDVSPDSKPVIFPKGTLVVLIGDLKSKDLLWEFEVPSFDNSWDLGPIDLFSAATAIEALTIAEYL